MRPAPRSSAQAEAVSLASQGFRLVPIHTPTKKGGCSCGRPSCGRSAGKHPRLSDWAKRATKDKAQITSWFEAWPDTNIGIAFGHASGFLDIEVDVDKDGPASLDKLQAKLGPLPSTASFRSGGGGVHRLFRYPATGRVKTRTKLGAKLLGKEETGIDVRSDGGQSVAPPSLHVSGRTYEWEMPPDLCAPAELPPRWAAFLSDEDAEADEPADQDAPPSIQDLLNAPDVLEDVGPEEAKNIIKYISADDRDTWVLVGQCLKTQLPDDPQTAFDLWHEWSQTSEKYKDEEDCAYQWASFDKRDKNEKRATFRTAIMLAKEAGWSASVPPPPGFEGERKALREADAKLRERFEELLAGAQSDIDLSEVAEEIRTTELFKDTREALKQDYIHAFARIHDGRKMTKAEASELLSDEGEKEKRAKALAATDDWYTPFVYVADAKYGLFINTETSAQVSGKVFDDLFSDRLVTPIRRAQGIISPIYLPSSLVLNCRLIERTDGMRYAPGQPGIFERDGQRFVNTYRPNDLVVVDPLDASPDEQAAVATVRAHFEWMMGEERAAILLDFLAYLVQNPAKRVRWCYTIIGPKGVGKTFISYMMRAILGRGNVKDVGQATLQHTSFNGWAVGAQLNVIEEIKVDGVKKWEIMNSLKAAITNDVIDVHAKGRDPYGADNTASFLAFTNHENALAVDAGDRRYFVAHTVHYTKEDFISDLGGAGAATTYFNKLHAAVDAHPGVLAGWLASRDISGFNPSSAPDSYEKEDMANCSRSELESAIMTLVSNGEIPTVTVGAIEMDALKVRLEMAPDAGHVTGQALGRALRDLGYVAAAPFAITPVIGNPPSRWYIAPAEARRRKLKWVPGKESAAVIRRLLVKP